MALVGRLYAPAPTSMQRIVVLTLMCLIASVRGIQNIGSGDGGGRGGEGSYGHDGSGSGIRSQISNELTQRSDFYTVEYEPATAATGGTTNYQPPTELIGFTLADATVNRPATANAIAPTTFGHRHQAATLVPPQLQTTPILSYRDPYTDEHHHYTPSHQHKRQQQHQNHYEYSHHHDHYHVGGGGSGHQLQLITDDHRTQPQEYTVQSSLLVDAHQPSYDVQHNKRRITVGGGGGVGYQRPGLVFEEPLGVNSLYATNYAATRPLGPYTRPTRPPAPPPPPPPPPPPSSLSSSSSSVNGVRQRPYLSYDSHDYPPPSYFQQQQQRPPPPPPQQQQQPQSSTLQQLYAQSPQRQDTTAPNYANNFGNYLPNAQYQQLQQQQHQYQQQQQPETYYRPLPGSNTPHRPPAYNNYYNYQLGEVPPQATRPIYRPPPPSPTQPAQSPLAGLANLATLFSDTTQQYAPQFTNLLLGTLGVGGGGNGGGGGSSGVGGIASIASNLVGGGNRPLNTQLIRALENIARNDELQCVPKVLCQMIARQTERGQLPTFVTSPAITNFLAGFPTASPALIYGRAALLGISGGEVSCTRTYAKCPKNEVEILYYLNNHRGGFFKFFSEPAEKEQSSQQQHMNDDALGGSGGGGGGGSILNFLSALTGGGGGGGSIGGIGTISVPPTTPRPKPTTQAPDAFDNIASGIGGFFTQVLSDYLGGGVEYQRRRRRRRDLDDDEPEDEEDKRLKEVQVDTAPIESPEGSVFRLPVDFQDPEDDEDTQDGIAKPTQFPSPSKSNVGAGAADGETTFQFGHIEGRILHKDDVLSVLEQPKFFPDDEEQQERLLRSVIAQFNTSRASRRLKFPTAVAKTTEPESQAQVAAKEEASEGGHILFEEEALAAAPPTRKYRRRGKKLVFSDTETAATQHVKVKEEASEGNHVLFEEDAHAAVPPTRKDRRRGKKLVFSDTETAATQQVATVQQHQALTPQGSRVIFPDGTRTRSGRILNRPNEASAPLQHDDVDKFVISNAHRPEGSGAGTASLYLSQSHSSDSQYSSSITNRYSSTYSSQHNGGAHKTFKMYDSLGAGSAYAPAGSNMRYSSRYQTTTTRRPPPPTTPREDNKNIYVTNGQGVTEYFITPDGRKVYL